MGAWGLSLFQCDLDFDILLELNEETGLEKLEKVAGKVAAKYADAARRRMAENAKLREGPSFEDVGAKHHHLPGPPPKQKPDEINYSLYAKLCSDPEKVRTYLDASGTLSSFLRRLHKWMLDCRPGGLCDESLLHDCWGPGYRYCLTGACAMTLGAKLSEAERSIMRKYYKDVGFMRDAVKQLEKALEGYVNGKPWDFGSKGLEDTMRDGGAKEEDQLFPGLGMFNTWAPDHGRRKPEMQRLRAMVKNQIAKQRPTPEQIAEYMETLSFDGYSKKTSTPSTTSTPTAKKQDWPNDVCGGCGAKKRHDGEELDNCSKCLKRKYCSRKCQKDDWKAHKLVCTVARPNNVCGSCGAEQREDGGELNYCSRCKVRRYCSVQCQKDDWKTHKEVCKVA
ncbi:hypothetical protein PRZ48_006589 [Zasmidium cellare]|uniref:MYND-type domain-containing protein n=1 Tax=Zasmidium cellare TaxID=395010 RepID=A0ABR0ENI6_ZASCE|nr:hypothetical protein PRZ48_006589 [Zasmidium cellare]